MRPPPPEPVSQIVLPFDFIKKTGPSQLISFIQDEHPQTIALILAHLTSAHAATIISGLPHELRAEVARRIAIMDRTPPEAPARRIVFCSLKFATPELPGLSASL